MEIVGKIKWIDEVKTYGDSGFRKRQVVITTQEQYPQSLLIEFVQDKCNLLDAFQLEQNVRIGINLRGREWVNPEGETKYFNSIQGWRIEEINQEDPSTADSVAPFELADEEENEAEDDLPF
jgi:hypothetical protein